MAEADFLTLLVDETFQLQKSGEAKLSSLELKLSDYGLDYLKGEFIPQSQMLRFHCSLGVLDIPVNWSIFEASDVVVGEDNDDDMLLKVFKSSWKQNLSKLLVTHADGFCFIVGLKAGDENHLHDLLNPQEWLMAA